MKSKKQHKNWTPEEVEEARDRHWEKLKKSGSSVSPKEWNLLMNYYDDLAYQDESFEEYKKRKTK